MVVAAVMVRNKAAAVVANRLEEINMDFLISHWHCILPVVGIGIALSFMRKKPKEKKKDEQKPPAVASQQNNRD